MASELKPCPFCGKTPEVVEMEHAPYGPGSQWFVICECSAGGPNSDEKEDAISKWHRRALDPRVKALVRAARAFMVAYHTKGRDFPWVPANFESAIQEAIKAVERDFIAMEGE